MVPHLNCETRRLAKVHSEEFPKPVAYQSCQHNNTFVCGNRLRQISDHQQTGNWIAKGILKNCPFSRLRFTVVPESDQRDERALTSRRALAANEQSSEDKTSLSCRPEMTGWYRALPSCSAACSL